FTPRGATPGSPSFPTRRSSDLLLYPWLIILLFDLFVEMDWPLKRALSACPACLQQAVCYLADRRPLRFFSELAEIFDAFHLSPCNNIMMHLVWSIGQPQGALLHIHFGQW